MGFFGIGTGELLLILALALIIWGPNRLPEIARKLGNTMRTLKRATYDFTNSITKELELDEQPKSPPKTKADGKPGESASEKASVSAPAGNDQPESHKRH